MFLDTLASKIPKKTQIFVFFLKFFRFFIVKQTFLPQNYINKIGALTMTGVQHIQNNHRASVQCLDGALVRPSEGLRKAWIGP
jgi:hypothetical protein